MAEDHSSTGAAASLAPDYARLGVLQGARRRSTR